MKTCVFDAMCVGVVFLVGFHISYESLQKDMKV